MKRWIVFAAIVVFVVLGHESALRWAAGLLCVPRDDYSAATHCLPRSGEGVMFVAAEWIGKSSGREVVLWGKRENRITLCGAIPSVVDQATETLASEGVPQAKIETLDAAKDSAQDDRMRRWLATHREAVVVVYVAEFDGRRTRWWIDSQIEEADRQRVVICPIPDRRYGPNNWWKSRDGWKGMLYATVSTAFFAAVGPDAETKPYQDPDQYEQHFMGTVESRLAPTASPIPSAL